MSPWRRERVGTEKGGQHDLGVGHSWEHSLGRGVSLKLEKKHVGLGFAEKPELQSGTPYNGLPWELRWQRICLQCRKPGFNPWVRKIPWRRK